MIGPFGNPDSLRTLATALSTAGTDVSTNASSVGGQVDALTATKWTGGAATAFQTHWNGEYTSMVDLGFAGTTMSRVLTDLATSLDQANQLYAQAVAQSALQGTVGVVTGNPVGAVTSVSSTMSAAIHQAMQIAQKAWALAMSQLSNVAVPKIGTLASPQQAAAWAQSAVAAGPTLTNLNVRNLDGSWQNGRKPPRPPWLPPFDPALNPGGVWIEPNGQTPISPEPFPGGGWLASSNAPAGDITVEGGKSGMSDAGVTAILLAAAAILAAGTLGNVLLAKKKMPWWIRIPVGLGIGFKILTGAPGDVPPPLPPPPLIEQLANDFSGVHPDPPSEPENQKPPGDSGQGGNPPPGDGWEPDGNGGWVKKNPDGTVKRIGP